MKLDPLNRALVATLFVLLALIGVRLGQQALDPAPGFSLSFDPADVETVSIVTDRGYLRLDRGGDGWRIGSPVDGPADEASVNRLLAAWVGFETSYMAVSESRDRADHGIGLDRNAVTLLRFETADEIELVSLEVGARATEGQRYLRREADHAIYVGPVPAEDLLTPLPARWLDRAALAQEAAAATAFTLQNPHGTWSFTRTTDAWTAADGGPVRGRAVDQMVRAALELATADAVSRETALPEDARVPRISLSWTLGEVNQTAHLCAAAPDGRVFLHRDTPALYVVDASEFTRFDVTREAFAPAP